MLKQKWIFVIAVALFSSFAFADEPVKVTGQPKDEFEFFCKFNGNFATQKGGKSGLECWVEGTGELDQKDVTKKPDGHEREAFKVKCNSGFELRSEETAQSIDDGRLFINADRGERIATLRVERFLKDNDRDNEHDHDHGKVKYADLLLGDSKGDAARLSGTCEFKFKKDK